MTERLLSIDDVLSIPASALPLIVFTDNIRSFLGWAIRARTKGVYNHVAFMVSPKLFLSQDAIFREVSAEKYLQGSHRLKFVGNRYWSNAVKRRIRAQAVQDVGQPWYKRRYDFLGIFGQLFGVDALNIPWLDYCSERVADYVRMGDPDLTPKHPCPTRLNNYTKDNQARGYYVYGRYIPD